MKKHLLLFKTLIIVCLAMVTGGGISVAQTETYEKVTDVGSLEAGASVIIVNGSSNVALSITQNTNNRGQVSITINNGVITPSDGVAILTLGGNDKDGWSFYDAANNGYLYAASSSDNYLRTKPTIDANCRAAITISTSGDATIQFKGKNTNNLLRYNATSKIFSCYSSINNQYPVQIYKLQSSKTPTTTTFGGDVDNQTFKVLVGQENSFKAPTATFSPNNATGTLTYSSDNTAAIGVDSNSGELTFKAIGKATITATFSGDENYYASSASYTIDYTDGRIVISNDNSSFDNVGSYKDKYTNYSFPANDGNSYTFNCIQIMTGNGKNLQMNASSGVAKSPSFDFEFGYKVNVTYFISNNSTPLTIKSGSLSASGVKTVTSGETTIGTGYMATLENIPARSSFTIKAGGNATYVSKIEIIPYTIKQKTAITFPEESYEVLKDEENAFKAPTATLTDASGNAIEGASLVYSISKNPFATIDSKTGVVSFITNPALGSATVTASYAGDNTYSEASASYTINYIENPYTKYTSFKDIKTDAASDEKVRITLNNAQVVYANGTNVFVRDASGAICFYNTGLDIKQNDILNGTLKATYTIYNGLPELIKDGTNTNADNLTITAGEAAQPKDLTHGSFADYTCDLVKVSKGVVDDNGTDVKLMNQDVEYAVFYNKFEINYSNPFNSAEVDVTGIVIPYVAKGSTETIIEIAPTNKYDIVYRFSENDKTTPVGEVSDAKVAIERTLSSDYWNTLCLPFSLNEDQIKATFGEGTIITKFEDVNEGGTVMTFVEATSIEAGKPYLFKPANTVPNPVFEGVTITSADAGSVTVTNTNGNYAFVGTYSKKDMATDQSEVFITTSGKLSYPAAGTNTIKGMRAFIQLPETTNAKAFILKIGGEATSIDTIDGGLLNGNATIYNLNGQKMSSDINGLAKGLYIVNGKKMIVK